MTSNINILFLGGSKRVSIAEQFIKTGAKKNINVTIYSYELDKNEPIGYVGTILLGLKWTDPLLEEHLEKVIHENNIDIVVPFVDIASIICNNIQKKLEKVHFCTSSQDITKIMFDKKSANSWFLENNINVPSTEIKPPLIAKLNRGSGAKGMHLLKTNEELAIFFKTDSAKTNYFCQEFIEGDEYTVDCYIEKSGRLISVVPRKRIVVVGGEVVKSITEKNTELIKRTKEIIEKGKLTGPINVQFIRQKTTGIFFIMEINPRLGSGVLASIEAGANVCEFIINEFQLISNEVNDSWRENLLMVRAFREFYFYANNN
jgi:carbamoyl-phosphate synthase large subunit